MTGVRVVILATLLGVTLLVPAFGNPLVAAGTWAACVALIAISHPSRMLAPACLYLALLGLFHLGLVVPLALGVGIPDPPSWVSSQYVGPALSLFSVATVAFTLGACARVQYPVVERLQQLPPNAQLFWVGGVVAGLGAALLWIGVIKLGVFSMGYDVYFQRAMTEDVRFLGFGLMLFPIGVLVAATGATRRAMFVLGGVLLIVLGPLFLFGFRGPVIVQVTALLAVWASKDPRTARRLAWVVAAAAIVLVPAVRVARNLQGDLSSSVGRVDPMDVLAETGGSLYPLAVTAERMDAGSEPLWMGRSYAMAVKRIMINFSTRWTPSTERTLTPSTWATMHADKWVFEHGGGIGYSGVAEPYLNFGVAGLVLFFLGLGFLVRQWDRWLTADPFHAAVGAASFGAILWTVRNDAIELFRVVALSTVTVLAAWILFRLHSWRQVSGRDADLTRAGTR